MQLPGPGVFGPPRDRDAAIAVLGRAAELDVDHIDTAQYYGPGVANELIRAALFPYPEGLALVSVVLAPHRGERGRDRQQLSDQVADAAIARITSAGRPEVGDEAASERDRVGIGPVHGVVAVGEHP